MDARARERVLVVDDEDDIRFLLGMILDEAGYEVMMAAGGHAGLELIETGAPDLVFLDLRMPDISGWDVLERMKSLPSPPPVILISGYGAELSKSPAGGCVAGFLLKPFRVEEVLLMTRTTLEARRAAEPTGNERRHERRRSLVMEAKLLGRDGEPIAIGTILNLSPSGAQFELGAPMEPGKIVRLCLDVPGMEPPICVEGRIRWRRTGTLGLEFEALSPEQAKQLRWLLGEQE
jgi:CheY-like chemotaxis protein